MKRQNLLYFGMAGFLAITACGKKPPVASAPPAIKAPVEVAATPPAAKDRPQAAKTEVAKATPAKPQTTAGPAKLTPEQRATLNQHLARLADAMFDYDKATIRPDAMTVLRSDVDVIRDILANYPAQKLVIEGHADERGSAEYNMALGDKRASSSEDFLANMGIPKNQLTIISYGKDRPVCTQESEDCWQRNRRVHITAAP